VEFEAGIVYHVNKEMTPLFRLVGHEGGTRSGKSYNTIEFLIDEALDNPFIEITIASRTAEHLRKGAMKDFLEIMQRKRRIYKDSEWYASAGSAVYKFANGAYIEFLNADEIGKVSGPGRDILFCNEVNFLKKPVFDQMLMRTRKYCIFDYNPVHPRHWIYDKVLTRKDCFLWKSTYLDNLHFLPDAQLQELLMMKETDPLRWQVYGLGLRASYQKGQIYGRKMIGGKWQGKDWQQISLSDYKEIAAQEYFGLDWGYFPDPNAVVGVKFVGNKRYYRKIIYTQAQSDAELASALKEQGLDENSIFVADHSKKSIVELRNLGFPLVYAAVKGPGSIDEGIKQVQSKECYYVMDPDFEFEYTNYCYLLGPDEEPTGVPQDKHNHIMDALRMVELYKKYL
jgi:phage terminase, large subunit, PBSX family